MTRAMKECDIEWCNTVPENWEIKANKYIMSKHKELCTNYNGEDILSLTMKGVVVRDLDAGGKMPTSFDGYQRIYPNNLLMCLFDYDVTPRCIGLIKNNGLTSPAYSQFVMKDGNSSRYYYYYYLMIDHTKELLHLAKNLRHSFTEEQLGAIKTPVPPVDEQQKIADFLDEKCKHIDAVLEKTRASIEEYKQLKQSVITEAVTKGILPNRPMKDSGIEWIGQIPEDWNISKVKREFSYGSGLPITKENLIENGVPVISYGQIHAKFNTGVELDDKLYRYVSEDYLETNSNSLVNKYDFIFADTSEDLEGCGNCVYISEQLVLFAGYHTIVLRSKKAQDNKYTAYLFKSAMWRNQITSRVTGIKVFSISKKILNECTLLVPPLNEQLKIVNYLDSKCSEIDKLINKKEKLIEELETYKKSLIYEYVTGKKEVC